MANESPSNPPGMTWWTSCETYTWLAFGEARLIGDHIEFPKNEWSRDWKHWPTQRLPDAFVAIGTGKPWMPSDMDWEECGEDAHRAWAQQIMDETGESAECLNKLLTADIEQWKQNWDKLRQASRDVAAALCDGRLHVVARRAQRFGVPNISAVHEPLEMGLFLGPRGVSLFGWVDYIAPGQTAFDARLENDFGFNDYIGPFFDEVRFDAGQVRTLRVGQSSELEANRASPIKGRQVKGFNYQRLDEPLVQEALTGIASGQHRGPLDAARALADRAAGFGSPESKAKRLLIRIQAQSATDRAGKD